MFLSLIATGMSLVAIIVLYGTLLLISLFSTHVLLKTIKGFIETVPSCHVFTAVLRAAPHFSARVPPVP